MTVKQSPERARGLRLRAQGLVDRSERDAGVDSVVGGSCGLQAQDSRQAPLSVRARCRGVTAVDVERARVTERSIVRTWCMRGTLHYVATADLPWLLSLFGPLFVDRGRRRLEELGLTDLDCERAVAAVGDALGDDGPLTRDEIAQRLLEAGFEFDPDGQAPVHLVRRACLEGVACEAAPRDGQETYALLGDWVSLDAPPDRDTALALLARRYLTAYEPATPEDLYSWSGLYKRDVDAGWAAIADELTQVEVAGEQAWTLSPPDAEVLDARPVVRLLPMYDSYFLGHQDRALVLPGEHADRVYPGGGVIRATVVADGVAVGTWRLARSRATPTVTIEPFGELDPGVEAGMESEAEGVGRFLGEEIELRFADSGT